MKKLLKSLIVASVISIAVNSEATFTFTTTVGTGLFTNIFAGFNNPIQIVSVTATAGTLGPANIQFIDTPTNWLQYTNFQYTNTLSYATNWNTTWTNYYGVVSTNVAPIVVQWDVTNNLVQGTTNYWPVPLYVSVASNSTAYYTGLAALFNRGMWVTNSGIGSGTLTITYH